MPEGDWTNQHDAEKAFYDKVQALKNDRARLLGFAQDERAAALDVYRNAGQGAELRGQQMGGEAQRAFVGQGRSGDALAARRALMSGGRALTGVSGQTMQGVSAARMQGSGDVMTATGRRAQYEQALFEDWLRRKQSSHESERRQSAAYEDWKAADAANKQRLVGSLLGAGATMGAGISGAISQQEEDERRKQQGQQLQSYQSAPQGSYYGNTQQQSGSDYYSNAYDALYGTGGG